MFSISFLNNSFYSKENKDEGKLQAPLVVQYVFTQQTSQTSLAWRFFKYSSIISSSFFFGYLFAIYGLASLLVLIAPISKLIQSVTRKKKTLSISFLLDKEKYNLTSDFKFSLNPNLNLSNISYGSLTLSESYEKDRNVYYTILDQKNTVISTIYVDIKSDKKNLTKEEDIKKVDLIKEKIFVLIKGIFRIGAYISYYGGFLSPLKDPVLNKDDSFSKPKKRYALNSKMAAVGGAFTI